MKSLHIIFQFIKSDLQRYGVEPTLFNLIKNVLFGNHAFKFTFWLRMCSRKNIFFIPSRIIYFYYSDKYGLQIPYSTTIGYGLYLGHGLNVVINNTAIIGDNCNISHSVTIGSNHDNAAIIGDNVYIGPNSCIVENVKIGDNVTLGAGSIVVKDIAKNATAVGNPAKVISFNNPARYINNRFNP